MKLLLGEIVNVVAGCFKVTVLVLLRIIVLRHVLGNLCNVVGVGIHSLVSKFLISVVRRELADGQLINLNCDILDSVGCEVGNVKLFVVCNINTFTR